MPSVPTVRLARKEDLGTLIQFNQAMALETESKNLILEIVSTGVSQLLEDPGLGFYVVAQQDKKIVGSLMVTAEWSDWRNGMFWWIQSVYVLPEARKQGIYRQLYEFVKIEAQKIQKFVVSVFMLKKIICPRRKPMRL